MTAKTESGLDGVERIGAYRVVRRLATGGTSDVLLAKAEGPHGFERTVVLKVLLSHFGKDDEVAKMFAREASAYARLSHPAIVRLFDFFAVSAADAKTGGRGGQLVMVLEYVDGPPLARLKSMAKAIGKEIDDKASIYIASCIFDALAAAHSAVDDAQIPAPVVHRDVNPSNVLIPWDAYPKLADFGVAKVTGLGHHSVVGMVKGTYGYMAPEQVTGQEAVTPRADVYAAGIILWELLTRRRAFQRGALPEVEALRAMAEPRLPALESVRSDVDRTVREALRRCLEPRAEKRKITAEEMVSILHAVVSPDQGRERLMSLLGLVRNDARAANAQASIPPPAMPPPAAGSSSKELLPDVVIPGAPKMAPDFGPLTKQGVAPPPTHGIPSGTMAKAPPRPNLSSAKMPVAPSINLPSSAKMAAANAASGGTPADASIRDILSLPTRPAMPAVNAPAVPPPPQRSGGMPGFGVAGGALPPPEGPPRTKSAAARLAISLPPEATEEAPPRPLNSLLEGLGDPLGAQQHSMSKPPDSPRVAAPLKDLTGGLGLRDAIDEIMRSSSRMPVATPVQGAASQAADEAPGPAPGVAGAVGTPPSGSDRPQMRATTRVPAGMTSTLIGLIPPAPPPMSSLVPPDGQPPSNETVTSPPSAAAAATGDDFPNDDDPGWDEPRENTVVMEPAPITPRMQTPPNAPKAPNMGATLAMEACPPTPSITGSPAPPGAVATGAMGRYTPPPMPAVHTPQAIGMNTPDAPPVISRPPPQIIGEGPRPSTPAPSYHPPTKKGSSVGAVAVALVAVIALGIGGTVVFVRYQANKEMTDAGTYVPPPRPTVSAVGKEDSADAGTPHEPALVATTSAAPVSAEAGVLANAPDTGAATPSATPDASAREPIAEGMGLLKTPNAAPGRRIFVDDKVSGQTPETLSVKCGPHKVKLGSTGTTQDIDVPCGGEVSVGDK